MKAGVVFRLNQLLLRFAIASSSVVADLFGLLYNFQQVVIANADSGASAMMESAIEQACRAVHELS